jgi:hypothetical protein
VLLYMLEARRQSTFGILTYNILSEPKRPINVD